MALVSVIIPVYNPGELLEVAVRSVIAQTFQDWEIIIINDGSPQDVSFVEQMDPRIRMISQENSGQCIARNNAIAQAQSEFVAFLDQDDAWLPQKLERQIALLQSRPEVQLCHTNFDIIDGEGQRVQEGFGGDMDSYLRLTEGNGIALCTVVVRLQALKSVGIFDPFSVFTEDYDLWLRIARYYPIFGITDVLAQYRLHGQNMSRNYAMMFAVSHGILEKHRIMAQWRGEEKLAKAFGQGQKNIERVYGSQAFDRVRLSVRKKDAREAMPHLKFALRHSPVQVAQSLWSFVRRK